MNAKTFNKSSYYGYIRNKLYNLYEKYGYREISIPMFINYDLYRKYKGVPTSKQLKIIDKEGQVLVLTPDATFHALKAVRDMKKYSMEKYFYSTKVFRLMSSDYKDNELSQCGIELYSLEEEIYDAEIIKIGIDSLLSLGIEDIRVDLGHADFVYALIEETGVKDKNIIETLHKLIEDKNSVDLVSYLEKLDVNEDIRNNLERICMLFGDFDSVMKEARTLSMNEKMEKALDNLQKIYDYLKSYNVSSYIYLDLGFTNPMNYYSGMIFKVYSLGASNELICGGRYDRLAKKFAKREAGLGFSHNIDLTIKLLFDKKIKIDDSLYIIMCSENKYHEGIILSEEMRKSGLNVFLQFCEKDSLQIYDTVKKVYLSPEEIYAFIGGDND